ncbi:MAG: ABC transporter substrate-binding protein, partial [Chloroflexota bacterium]
TFRRIKVHLYQGHAALAAYAKGALDLVSGAPAGQDVFGSAVGLRRVAALSLDYLAFNTTRLPFLRLNARRAFAAASQSTVVNRNLGDTAFAAGGYLPSTFGIRIPSWRAIRSPASYLARARYPHGRGLSSIVLVAPADPRIAPLVEGIARRWRAVLNTQVVVRQLDPSIYDRVLSAHAFDVALVRWGADYADPQDFLGTQLGTSGGNVTGWQARIFNRDVKLADSYNPADPRRVALFKQAARIAVAKVPLLPLDEPTVTALIRPGLVGISLTPLGTISGRWAQAHFTS